MTEAGLGEFYRAKHGSEPIYPEATDAYLNGLEWTNLAVHYAADIVKGGEAALQLQLDEIGEYMRQAEADRRRFALGAAACEALRRDNPGFLKTLPAETQTLVHTLADRLSLQARLEGAKAAAEAAAKTWLIALNNAMGSEDPNLQAALQTALLARIRAESYAQSLARDKSSIS